MPVVTHSHFNDLAKEYDQQIPDHIREYLCIKKTDIILENLRDYPRNHPDQPLYGLDIGCGTGWHIRRLRSKWLEVTGIDISPNMVHRAQLNNEHNAHIVTATADNLPFDRESFDFAYAINVLHHLASTKQQNKVIGEAYRVLKKRGRLLVFDMNAKPILFKLYLNYIMPLTNRIDHDQDEHWLSATYYHSLPGWNVNSVKYFTFLPNITPRPGYKLLTQIESLLEKATNHQFGAHYCICLEKTLRPR